MSNRSNNSNQPVVSEAREALNKFKMEAASEVGVDLKKGYNGDLTSREAGSVGGQMVKHICPVRTVVYERANRRTYGHVTPITYQYTLSL